MSGVYGRIAIIAFFVLASSIPISYASPENSTLGSQGGYANPSLGIEFQAPAGWTVEEPKKFDPGAPDVAVVAPYSSNFTASISLNVESANATTLDSYVRAKTAQLEAGNPAAGIRLLSEQPDTVDGFPASTLLFEENFTSKGQGSMIKFKQAMVKADGRFYTITYANDLKDFDSALPDYGQMISSLKLGGGTTAFPLDYLSMAIVIVAVGAGLGMSVLRKSKRPQGSQPKKG